MAGDKDPEKLIAEALRAQAVRTPLPESGTQPVAPEFGGAYGLLSGTDAWAPRNQPAEHTTVSYQFPGVTTKIESRPQIGGWWILLFALVLGLAAGAVIGLATLL